MSAKGVGHEHECRQFERAEENVVAKVGVLQLRRSVRKRTDKLRSG
jgi:hypothetical protein